MLTAQQILSSKKCGDLFSSADKQVVIAEYREIARAYHPDISSDPQANEVMAKVNQLYEEALRLIESGTWEVSNRLILRDKLGKKYIGKYLKQFPFELGEAYIANSTVTYVFKENHKRFFDNAVSQIKGLRYANKKMEEEMSRFMPRILYALSLDDGRFCLVLNKPEDVFLLSDIKDFFGGSLPDRHVAWIMSRLSNLCCYFSYTGIAHNGLTLQNCFICPSKHSITELNEKTDEELEEMMMEREDGYYGIPEECCPICQFIEYSNKDLAKYLEREYKVSRDEVFAKVKQLNKRRKKLYDSEYVTEVCSRFHLNPAEIVAGLKDRFGTYSRFYDFIHKG